MQDHLGRGNIVFYILSITLPSGNIIQISYGADMADKIVGIIGGTGLEDALAKQFSDGKFINVDTPFGKPSMPIFIGSTGKKKVAFINRHGRGHELSPSEVPCAANIFALKKIGASLIIATGTVGSLRDKISPGDLVIVDQFIDKTFKRQNSFFTGFGAVHCEMAQPVCTRLSKILYKTAKKMKLKTHPSGTYVCMEGPQFSTRAESLMHRIWGGDLIGMTAMPEAKLAKEAQMCYALIALVCDYDCWKSAHSGDKQILIKEILSNLKLATDNCLKLIEAVLNSQTILADEKCPCRKSLELAVWTDKKQIKPQQKNRLKVLFE
jgi:5'-methylthioadenosine phosphorylase